MSETVPFFFIDRKKEIKYPEQGYLIDCVSDTQMILSIALPRLGSFVKDGETTPVEILSDIVDQGTYTTHLDNVTGVKMFHYGMAAHWPKNITYQGYDVHVDFAKSGVDEVQHVAMDKDQKVCPVFCDFDHIDHLFENADKQDDSLKRILSGFRHFNLMNRMRNGDKISWTQKRNADTDSTGYSICWGMSHYIRKAISKKANKENISLLRTVYKENSEFVTAQDPFNAGAKPSSFSTPFTDIVKRPAAFINRIQMNAVFKKGQPRFTQSQMDDAAAWINENQETMFVRKTAVRHKNPLTLTHK